MKILLVNDDGIQAEGILALARALSVEHEIVICAPDRQQSGTSHSMIHHITAKKVELDIKNTVGYAIAGTPVNCTIAGLQALMPDAELVISGVNAGRNAGMDIHYSGTVAAAMEAALSGKPALALSLKSSAKMDYTYAADFVRRNLSLLFSAAKCIEKCVININFPAFETPKGVLFTKTADLDSKDYLTLIPGDMEDGLLHYQISGTAKKPVYGEGTDLLAIEEGYISISGIAAGRGFSSLENIFAKMPENFAV